MADGDEVQKSDRLPDLHRAVKRQDLERIRALLANGADPNGRWGREYGTPLGFACNLCNTRVITLLLDAGADPNLPHVGEWTPLVLAASEGSMTAVSLLLAAGADPNRPFHGSTVVSHVRRYWQERTRMIALLESAMLNTGQGKG